jgi:type II secretory pathway component PulK
MSNDMAHTQNNFWHEARQLAQWGRHSCLPLGHSCPPGVCPPRTACFSRRGVIFVTALWVILILGVLVLMFARAMRTEVIASQTRTGGEQVDAIVEAGIQYALGVCDAYAPANTVSNTPGDALSIVQSPGEAMQVGNGGYFWFIHSNPDDLQNYYYGITDESSKLYLNTATSEELQLLPNMDPNTSDSIVDWVDSDSTPRQNGAESDYYSSLPRPYVAKNAGFESVEELMLVKGFAEDPLVGAQLLWGGDINRNGVLDQGETSSTTSGGQADFSCGLFPFITCWATQPDTDANGKARTKVTATQTGGGGGGAPGGRGGGGAQVNQALVTALTANPGPQLTQQRAQQIAQLAAGQTFTSVFDFVQKTRMTDDEARKSIDYLTTSTAKTLTGKLNINTVPMGVLQCLPNLQPGDAQAIIGARSNAASATTGGSGMEWVFGQVSATVLSRIGPYITGHSYQYSADIVAVTADGQFFRRVRVVIDCQQSPAKIIYRKDMTQYGWPLPKDIRDQMKAGTFQAGGTDSGVLWRP